MTALLDLKKAFLDGEKSLSLKWEDAHKVSRRASCRWEINDEYYPQLAIGHDPVHAYLQIVEWYSGKEQACVQSRYYHSQRLYAYLH